MGFAVRSCSVRWMAWRKVERRDFYTLDPTERDTLMHTHPHDLHHVPSYTCISICSIQALLTVADDSYWSHSYSQKYMIYTGPIHTHSSIWTILVPFILTVVYDPYWSHSYYMIHTGPIDTHRSIWSVLVPLILTVVYDLYWSHSYSQ